MVEQHSEHHHRMSGIHLFDELFSEQRLQTAIREQRFINRLFIMDSIFEFVPAQARACANLDIIIQTTSESWIPRAREVSAIGSNPQAIRSRILRLLRQAVFLRGNPAADYRKEKTFAESFTNH